MIAIEFLIMKKGRDPESAALVESTPRRRSAGGDEVDQKL